MKTVSANNCYTHSTEEKKMLISFDFLIQILPWIVSLIWSMSTAISDDVRHRFDLKLNFSLRPPYKIKRNPIQ